MLSDELRPVHVVPGTACRAIGVALVDQLSQLRDGVTLHYGPPTEVARELAGIGPGSVVVVMDTRRYERWVIEAAAQAQGAGASVVAVTDTPLSPLVAGSDAHLLVRVVGAGPFDSLTGALSVVNALAAGVAARAHRGAGRRLRRAEEALKKAGALVEGIPMERGRCSMTIEPTPNAVRRIAEQIGMDARGPLRRRSRGEEPDRRRRHRLDSDHRCVAARPNPRPRTERVRRWRDVPAPRRGEVVRLLGQELRRHKESLGELVTLEAGKVTSEGRGEVQEMIDVCDFAVGLSRQLYGATMTSERPGHRLMEQWHPMGPVGIITAFNFPVAVWAWNAALALVCGDPIVWKPSEKAPLCALACHAILDQVLREAEPDLASGGSVGGLSSIVIGDKAIGAALVGDDRVPVISATGSTEMGRVVGQQVAGRFGRSILELGGNNALIVCPSAEMDLATRATVFSAVGTAGQRCTSLRRLLVHTSVRETLIGQLTSAYESVEVGDPRDSRHPHGTTHRSWFFRRHASGVGRGAKLGRDGRRRRARLGRRVKGRFLRAARPRPARRAAAGIASARRSHRSST